MNEGRRCGDDQDFYYGRSFTFPVMWLHGTAFTAVGPRDRFGIRPELWHSRMLLPQRFFFFPFFACADFLTTFLAGGLAECVTAAISTTTTGSSPTTQAS